MANATKRPNIPGLAELDPELQRVLRPVKELLDIHEGRVGASGDRFVRLNELSNLDIVGRSIIRPSDGSAPDPPTNVQAVGGAFANRVSWTNASNEDLWAVEVFCAVGTNDWTLASLVGTVTIPQEQRGKYSQFVHNMADILGNHYYWVRSVDYSGNASRLAPSDPEDGLMVAGEDTVGQTIDEVLAALTAPNAPDWMSGISSYEAGDIVIYDTRLYQCYNAPVAAGVTPDSETGADHWRRTGILVQGDVDGRPTVGVNGELVVENTIYARALKVDEIQAQLIDTQQLQVRYNILVGAKPPVDADNTQEELDLGADIENAKANGHTLIQGGYINTDILLVDTAQIVNLAVETAKINYAAVDTLRVKEHAVSTVSSAFTTSAMAVSSSAWTQIQSLTVSLPYAADLIAFGSCRHYEIFTGDGVRGSMQIKLDGVVQDSYDSNLVPGYYDKDIAFTFPPMFSAPVSAGNHTVTLEAKSPTNVYNRSIVCFYLLR